MRAEGFSTALERIYSVANTVDSKTMSLQYFDTTRRQFPMEFTSMLSGFLNPEAPNQPRNNGENNT